MYITLTGMRRLPLKKLKNCRDLGGYATTDGGITRFKVFLRAEVPHQIPQEDLDFLQAYGVKTVMDFRGEAETLAYPSSLKDVEWIRYQWSPMFTQQVAPQTLKKGRTLSFKFDNWEKHYLDMAEDFKPWMKLVIETAAECESALLYNCTTGKDRTGILSALLLSIAGVDQEDIIADYCVSMVYLHNIYCTFGFQSNLPQSFFETPPQAMRGLLKHFDNNYGGVESYLTECGVNRSAFDNIRLKFVER